MNPFIQVFQTREPFGDNYVLPALDVLNDSECVLPATPQMTSVYPGSVGWFTVPGATGYKIERRTSGTEYELIGTVEGSTGTEIVWHSDQVTHYKYFRVIAVSACGESAPSAPMDFHREDQQGSGDSACVKWSPPPPADPYLGILFLTGGASDLSVPSPGTEIHNDGDWTAVHSHTSGMTSLECQRAAITTFDVTGCTSLLGINASNNLLTNVDLTTNTGLWTVVFNDNLLTTLNISGITTILALWVQNNAGLTTFDISSSMGWSSIHASGCAINEATVNAVLAQAVAMGTSGGEIDFSGGTSAAPTGQGIADATNLVNNFFWTITTN